MLWYPYQQMKTMNKPYEIVDAKGVYLYTKEKRLIDSISSWWSVIHGYKNKEMNEVMISQIKKFSHIMLGGLSHKPAEELAEKLKSWLPGDLNHTFFSDSGSVAVEVAIKMAIQYFINKGQNNRKKILSLTNSYHGDTFKTMEIGDDVDYHFILKSLGKNKNIIHIPTNIPDLEKIFKLYGNELCCFIVEPLLQGAGGIKIYELEFLKRARELCNEYEVLLIFDEVATGFGRTGYRFVSDVVLPDILILGKALTGGYIGHAATIANDKVYYCFYDDNPEYALMHGPTFMGNPLACCVALKSIEIFERENYLEKIKNIEKITKKQMLGFKDERIKEIRIMGGCICIEVKDNIHLQGFQQFAYERGVFSRPFLNYLYAMVPYIIEERELIKVLDTMKEWFEIKK